jgi:predicted ATPase/class 3 adenylate cyclase
VSDQGEVAVTLLFTDIEESTRLWADFPELMPDALARHDAILGEAVRAHSGRVIKWTGDGVTAVFPSANAALQTAVQTQCDLAMTAWPTEPPLRSRMAIHTGRALARDGDYFGMSPNLTARLRDAGHGGQILVSAGAVEALADGPPPDVELVAQGVHRLRGIPGDHRIYQVGHPDLPSRFPALRTLDPGPGISVPSTSLHGRSGELREMAALVARRGAVTLVGPGGVGKTRLAVELAAEGGHRFRDGVRVVDLAPLDAGAVASTLAAELGLVRRGGRSFQHTIIDWLRGKHVLLVLDNCEHVLLSVSRLVHEVTTACGQVTVLATSRQALGFPGEVVFTVDPLGLPRSMDIAEVEDSPAVRLFADRAGAASHGLQLRADELAIVADICRRLDGIPLAIELAAARVRTMSLGDLQAHLHPRSPLLSTRTPDHPRHRTLLSTIQWSYDLLPSEERTLFERLSVFAGSWTLEAAHCVCAGDEAELDVLSLLVELVDRSMIVADLGPGQTRYRMLTTLHDFAADRLGESGDAERFLVRHADYYAGLANDADAGLRSAREAEWVTTVAADFANLYATHVWSVEHEDVDREADLLVSLWYYGFQRQAAEVFRWVEEAIDRLSFDEHPRCSEVLGIAALGAWLRGDLHEAARCCEASLEAEARLGSPVTHQARIAMVYIAAYGPAMGDPRLAPVVAAAPARFLEVVAWARAQGEPFSLAYSMVVGSYGLGLAGDTERATRLARRALETARLSGCPTLVAWGLLAVAMQEQGEASHAEELLEEAITAAREVESRFVLGGCLSLSATLRRRLGRTHEAVEVLREALDVWERLGNQPQLWLTLREATICLGLLGADDAAARLLGAVEASEIWAPSFPADRADLAAVSEELRRRLGDGSFDAARAEGAGLGREAIVQLAAHALDAARDVVPQAG